MKYRTAVKKATRIARNFNVNVHVIENGKCGDLDYVVARLIDMSTIFMGKDSIVMITPNGDHF